MNPPGKLTSAPDRGVRVQGEEQPNGMGCSVVPVRHAQSRGTAVPKTAGPGRLHRGLVLIAALSAAVTGCGGRASSIAARPSLSRAAGVVRTAPFTTIAVPPASSPSSPAATSRASVPAPAAALAVAGGWGRAWCGWDYRRPYGARERSARALMTAAGSAALIVTPSASWRTQVVGPRQVATCGSVTVVYLGFSAAAPKPGAKVAYVLITAQRTVTDVHGTTSEAFSEPRRLSRVHGRWLVDVLVEGG
jgi:hypothetical protein